MAQQNSNQHETFVLGNNVVGHMEGTELVLRIDTTKDYGLSSSGKTHTVASTGGFKQIPGTDISFNGNFCRKP